MSNLVAAGLASYQAPGFEGQVAGELSVAQPAAEGAMEEGHGKEAHQLAAAEGEAKETSEEEEGEEEQQHAEPKQQAENLMQPQQAMPYPGLWSFPFAGMNGQPPPQAYPYAMQHPYSGYWPFPHGMHPGTLGQPIGKNDKTGKRRRKKKPAMEGAPKKPATSFVMFSNQHRAQVRADNPDLGFLDIGRKLGEMWRALDAESKKVYEDRATTAKDAYLEQKCAWEIQQKALTSGGGGGVGPSVLGVGVGGGASGGGALAGVSYAQVDL